jgi:hypothetical protein
MRPRGQNLITKGILAFVKSVSLATKGILDELVAKKRGGESLPRSREYIFLIQGKKLIDVKFIYNIIAIRQLVEMYEFFLKGKKELVLYNEFLIQAKKITDFINEYYLRGIIYKIYSYITNINGIKEFTFQNELDLAGRKETKQEEELILAGIKQYDFNLEEEILGTKQISLETGIDMSGTKETKLDNELIIKGRRDITSILFALDLLEEK